MTLAEARIKAERCCEEHFALRYDASPRRKASFIHRKTYQLLGQPVPVFCYNERQQTVAVDLLAALVETAER